MCSTIVIEQGSVMNSSLTIDFNPNLTWYFLEDYYLSYGG